MKIPNLLWRHRWKLLLLVILLLAGWWVGRIYGNELTLDALISFGRSLPAGGFIATFFVLPLVGVPISVFLVLAGIRFGFWGGMALATAGVFFHNFVAYHVTHRWMREQIRNYLKRSGRKIPVVKRENHIWFTALFTAIHGPPYALKLYLLALSDISFCVYFWVGAPVYILFCVVPVGAGSAVRTFDPTWIYVVLAVGMALVLAGRWLAKRHVKEK